MAPRSYEMRARAGSTELTRSAILDATIGLAYELERLDFPLEQIAQRAGRSIQTVLRHFGSREALIESAIQRGLAEVIDERRVSGDQDPLDVLVAHYERRGRFILRLLGRESDTDAEVTAPGKLLHREWVEHVYGRAIRAAGPEGPALADMLVVVTDVYAWKLLRLDRGLGAQEVVSRMTAMVHALVRREC